MKWLLVFLPFWVKGQCLKPGTYHNLKPTEPLVLDTGRYTFVGLEMKDLGNGVWLDARTARKLKLIGCSFIGNGEGTAVVSSGDLVVSSSVFSRLACAVHYQAIGHRQVKVYRNTFTDNETSIWLSRKDGITEVVHLDFTLKCNRFEHDATDLVSRRGLVIGEGVALRSPDNLGTHPDQIGGSDQFNSGNQYPNANVWPTASDRNSIPNWGISVLNTPNGWALSPYWVSIENHSSNEEVVYHRFLNEFVGFGASLVGPVGFPNQPPTEWVVTGNQVEDPIHVKACANFIDPVVLFPVLRIALVDSSAFTSKIKSRPDSPYLLDAVPNPAQQQVKIGLYLPGRTEQAVLQILELATGKVLQNIAIKERGSVETTLDVSKAPAGVYGYRLTSHGQPEPMKKLIVTH